MTAEDSSNMTWLIVLVVLAAAGFFYFGSGEK